MAGAASLGAKSANTNLLVLAGPGSGKTRVVAHRWAYLLRVERVRPERILVACFNRHAALQLRHDPQHVGSNCAFHVDSRSSPSTPP